MDLGVVVATLPVTFFDRHSGCSALVLLHVRAAGRVALVYHDAPSATAARPFLAGVAETLMADVPEGQVLGMVESSVPEHDAEPFVYARVALSRAAWPGRIDAGTGRVLGVDAVADACGVTTREVQRTETLVLTIHRRRSCAFPGFRQLPVGGRLRRVLEVA